MLQISLFTLVMCIFCDLYQFHIWSCRNLTVEVVLLQFFLYLHNTIAAVPFGTNLPWLIT